MNLHYDFTFPSLVKLNRTQIPMQQRTTFTSHSELGKRFCGLKI